MDTIDDGRQARGWHPQGVPPHGYRTADNRRLPGTLRVVPATCCCCHVALSPSSHQSSFRSPYQYRSSSSGSQRVKQNQREGGTLQNKNQSRSFRSGDRRPKQEFEQALTGGRKETQRKGPERGSALTTKNRGRPIARYYCLSAQSPTRTQTSGRRRSSASGALARHDRRRGVLCFPVRHQRSLGGRDVGARQRRAAGGGGVARGHIVWEVRDCRCC